MGSLSLSRSGGSTLLEVIIGAAIFALIATSVYQTYTGILIMVNASRAKTVASALANEQFEIIRNLPYADVGIEGGIPAGKLIRFQSFSRSGISFNATTTIRNIDDPFDGEIGSTTAPDLSPADYKDVEIEIGCSSCKNFVPLVFSTTVAPKNLETASTNGALFIKVFDANGVPLSGARVQVNNSSTTPVIAIDEVTNTQGLLQLVDVPPSIDSYRVTVSKSGYSTERTYQPGAVGNPNPTKPHATVALQQVTQISFSIDRTGTLAFTTASDVCSPIPNISFDISGAKLVGTAPDVLKWSSSKTSNGSGEVSVSGLEWDTYAIALLGTEYALGGSIPPFPFSLSPSASQNVSLILKPYNSRHLLVTVRDGASGLPVADADVRFELNSYDQTFSSGRGFLSQSDWRNGPGQAVMADGAMFFSDNGTVDYTTTPGEVKLTNIFGEYQTPGELISSTFDTGGAANFYQISWNPGGLSPDLGAHPVSFQFASGNDPATTTWNFLGPDGTSGSFYTTLDQNIAATHSGDRYFRYKMFLQTASTTLSPSVSDVSATFTSSCIPPGQVLFSGIGSTGQGSVTVSKAGYQTYTANDVSVNGSYQTYDVTLTP